MNRIRLTGFFALRLSVMLAVLSGAFRAAPCQAQQPDQKLFATTGEASHALFAALEKQDAQAMKSIFGKKMTLLTTDDGLQDGRERAQFLLKYKEMRRLVKEPDGGVVLYIGAENWPFPVPLLYTKAGWYFDTDAGMEEVMRRHIGTNEANAILTGQAFAQAQKRFAAGGKTLLHGYYFCAARRNPNHPGGAVIASHPAEYRVTGVKTFLISPKGVVYEKDLGPGAAKRSAAMTRYRVDSTWVAVR